MHYSQLLGKLACFKPECVAAKKMFYILGKMVYNNTSSSVLCIRCLRTLFCLAAKIHLTWIENPVTSNIIK